MDIMAGEATIDPQEAHLNCHDPERKTFTHGMFERMDQTPPTFHLLPLDGNYEEKLMENGEPLFVYHPRMKLRRDDVVHFNPRDVQHADRIKR
jgi:hypothetical protein